MSNGHITPKNGYIIYFNCNWLCTLPFTLFSYKCLLTIILRMEKINCNVVPENGNSDEPDVKFKP